ncbi:unnamed protein product [Prunus armeniaca]
MNLNHNFIGDCTRCVNDDEKWAGQRSIIFLINNGGYTIEVEIHDGPYNVIKNWDYSGLIDAVHNGEGKCWTTKVRCEDDLIEAIEVANGDKKDCLCFIEVIVHKDDTIMDLNFNCVFSIVYQKYYAPLPTSRHR